MDIEKTLEEMKACAVKLKAHCASIEFADEDVCLGCVFGTSPCACKVMQFVSQAFDSAPVDWEVE